MIKSTRVPRSGAVMSLVLGLGLAGSPWPAAAQDAPTGIEPVIPGEAPPEVMEECAGPNADPVLCDADKADPAAGEAAPEPSEPETAEDAEPAPVDEATEGETETETEAATAEPEAAEPAPEAEAGAEATATEAEQVEEVPPADAAEEAPSAAGEATDEAPLESDDAVAGDAPEQRPEQDTDEPAAAAAEEPAVPGTDGESAVADEQPAEAPDTAETEGPASAAEEPEVAPGSAAEEPEASSVTVAEEPKTEPTAAEEEPAATAESETDAAAPEEEEAAATKEPDAVPAAPGEEPAAEGQPEPEPATAEERAPAAAGAEATAAEQDAVPEEALLSEGELEAAQRASVDEAVREALAAEEAKDEARREEERRDRMRILGAAAAGFAAGTLLPEIGARLVGQQGDRVILEQDERLVVRSDETERLLALGGESSVEEADGFTRLTVERPDGSRVLSWRDESGALVRRVRVLPDGREIVLFDHSQTAPVRVTELPPIRRDEQRTYFLSRSQPEEIRTALAATPLKETDARYTLRQILANEQVRWLMPSLSLDAVTFETGSAELGVDQVRALGAMGRTLAERIAENPEDVFLVEGHTDAVGSDIANLALSDRRAETMATLLTELYDVPPENLVTQGFGEADLKVPTMGPARENRRVDLRRLTPILQ